MQDELDVFWNVHKGILLHILSARSFAVADPLLPKHYSCCWKSQSTNFVDIHSETAIEGSQGQLWIRKLYNFLSFSEAIECT